VREVTMIRDKNGKFARNTILNKIKFFCNRVISKLEQWLK